MTAPHHVAILMLCLIELQVTAIGANPDGTWLVVTDKGDAKPYQDIIIAAPFHSTSIDLSLQFAAPVIPPQPYVHLHVTLLTTPNPHPRTRFFGLGDKDKVPTSVLTTWESVRSGEGAAPEFNSLTYHGLLKYQNGTVANTSTDGQPEWSVKIFSDQKLEDRWLRRAFGKIGWVHKKEVRPCCKWSSHKF